MSQIPQAQYVPETYNTGYAQSGPQPVVYQTGYAQPQPGNHSVVYQSVGYDNHEQDEKNALLLLLLGFLSFIPLIICAIKYRNSPSEKARRYAKIAIIWMVISLTFLILSSVGYVVAIIVIQNQ
ncbi:hypothetical protein AKO1_014251, partial [Acrasis kona]